MSEEYILGSYSESNYSLHKNFGELSWHELSALNGNRVCLIDGSTDERLTVAELKTRANSIAVALIERGITKEDKIAFCGQNSIQQIVMRFVAYFTGNTIVLMNPFFGKYEMEQALKHTGATVLVISNDKVNEFEDIIKADDNLIRLVVVVDGYNHRYVTYEELLSKGKDELLDRIPYFDVNADDILVMCHSSGTTGAAKCIMQSHQSCMNAIKLKEQLGRKESTVGTLSPLTLSGGHRRIHGILKGFKLIIFPKNDIQLIYSSIEKYRIDVLCTTPLILRKLFYDNTADCDLSCLKTVYAMADSNPPHITQAIHERHGFQLIEFYSLSEAGKVTSTSHRHQSYIPGNLGTVAPGNQLKIVDLNSGQALGPNIDGEVRIRGISLFSGYYNNDKDSEEAFDSEGWFMTGDIGHYDDEERLFITDRLKSFFFSGMARISPIELEHFLLTHKSIADVAVVGVNNSTGTKWPRAYVVLKHGHRVRGREIEKYVSDNMFDAKQLKAGVVFVDDIKRTELGKIERKYYQNLVMNEII